ncbi:DUF624 domain-containing protein [Vagococcus entomophilus]|uniref:Beta-carotene 15,15'-monooxygenase n=1 Tax=Vagococcus entomophilus TaxID=1160095 RepID=A0A430AKD9_9ENTE|nr:DUF624 domain-containing protein [Vagococcus entomophilus]RSU08529.1 hypothetical protein CBF30_04650 [Vagococcus entomophilus]
MGIFKIDGVLFTTLNRVANLFLLNILFLVSCLPLVTIGTALVALYQVSLKSLEDPQAAVVQLYVTSFKHQWKKGLMIGTGMLVINSIVASIVYFTARSFLFLSIPLFVIVAWLCLYNIYPYVFASQTDSVKQSLKQSVLCTFQFLPESILMFMEMLLLLVVGPIFLPQMFPFVILFGFSGVALLQSMQLKKMVSMFAEMK